MKSRYQVKYVSSSDGEDVIAILFKNGQLVHTVNVEHLIWEHLYNNKWVD